LKGRLPLEGKLSLKATDEVSPKRNRSHFNRKQKIFGGFSSIRELLFCSGDTSSVTLYALQICDLLSLVGYADLR